MSFSQQSGSDRAAAEADERRRQLGERATRLSSRPRSDHATSSGAVIAKFRAWVRRTLAR